MWKVTKTALQYLHHNLIRNISTESSLRRVFNNKVKHDGGVKQQSVGLFGISELVDSSGFIPLQQEVFSRTKSLVEEIIDPNRSRKLVQVFDELSDIICKVADMADFIRLAHPDQVTSKASEEACLNIGALVEQLNTNVPIYQALVNVVNSGDKFLEDDVDKNVAKLFLFDFEQSGIHLEEDQRQKFVELNEKVMVLSNTFMQNCNQSVSVPRKKIPPSVNMWFNVQGDSVTVTGLFSDNHSPIVRESAYRLLLSENTEQSQILDRLLASRHELAQLVGFSTYAHRVIRGTMAETPENVTDFLTELSDKIRPRAEVDFNIIRKEKERSGHSGDVKPWDVPYYSGLMKQSSLEWDINILPAYFSLGNCMEGLNLLFSSLYGVSLVPEQGEKGELWHPDVQKLAVTHETEGKLGTIYCDFYDRIGKSQQDCHFTIRGGRLKECGAYQQPVVVLHLNLTPPTPSQPSLLTPAMVENLFHEFGHAMHSMLGRTRYQHITGTRCPTDFAEVPSVLMEYFVNDERVLSQFARHYKTNEPVPKYIVQDWCRSRKLFAAADMQLQVFYSMMDQVFHGSHPLEGSTMDILAKVQNKYYSLPHVKDTAWHLRFSHLSGYGAKYYSYLMSRAVASKIWQQCFQKDPFSRSAGEKYRHEILEHGGGIHPTVLVEGLLEERPTMDVLVKALVEDISN